MACDSLLLPAPAGIHQAFHPAATCAGGLILLWYYKRTT